MLCTQQSQADFKCEVHSTCWWACRMQMRSLWLPALCVWYQQVTADRGNGEGPWRKRSRYKNRGMLYRCRSWCLCSLHTFSGLHACRPCSMASPYNCTALGTEVQFDNTHKQALSTVLLCCRPHPVVHMQQGRTTQRDADQWPIRGTHEAQGSRSLGQRALIAACFAACMGSLAA